MGVNVAYMDTDMTAGLDVPKISPNEVARKIVVGLNEGLSEILADERSVAVKSALGLASAPYL